MRKALVSSFITSWPRWPPTPVTKNFIEVFSVIEWEAYNYGEAYSLKKIARKANQKDSVKAEVPKSVRDSLAKIEKKVKKIKTEIRDLNKIADSLQVADSLSGKPLLATAYLKDELNKEKTALDIKYKALMDSVEVLNLVNHKPITAVQWIKYNKVQKKESFRKIREKMRLPIFVSFPSQISGQVVATC